MISVFFGPDEGLSEAKAKERLLSRNEGRLPDDLIKYDGYKDSVSDLIADCQSLSLFGGRKTILCTNCYYLTETPKTQKGSIKEADQDYDGLASYIKDPSPDTDLIMVANGPLGAKNSLVQALKDIAADFNNCYLLNEEDYVSFAFREAKDQNKTIDRNAALMLYERSNNDYLTFVNSLKKVLLYSDKVDISVVAKLVIKPLEDNIFEIVSSLVRGDTKKALKTYQDLREAGNIPLSILPAMVSQFRFMALVKYLIEEGYGDDSIAKELSGKGVRINPKRLYYTRKDTRSFSYHAFVRILNDLGHIEEDVKVSLDDADNRLELFIALFNKNYLNK